MARITNKTVSLYTIFLGLIFLLVGLSVRPARAVDNNLQISGALVSEPCTLDVKGNTLSVDFGTVIEKSLYSDTRTHGVPFTVTLTDCDTSLGSDVNLTFGGEESIPLPGLLVATGAGASGIAIGIETPEGVSLPLNTPTKAFPLQNGTTAIVLQAYVQAEPDAITARSLVPGEFTAAATIDASYP